MIEKTHVFEFLCKCVFEFRCECVFVGCVGWVGGEGEAIWVIVRVCVFEGECVCVCVCVFV